LPELGTAFAPRRPAFLTLGRPRALPALLAPAAAGAAFAYWRAGAFSWAWLIVTLAGAAAAHLSLNAAFDVVDDASGAHAAARADGLSVPTGSDAIAFGNVTRAGATRVAVAFALVALAAGIAIAAARDAYVLALGAGAYVLGVAAAAPPLRIASRAAFAGEAGVVIGALCEFAGAYGAQARAVPAAAFEAGLVPALLLLLVAFHQSFVRHRADREVGRPGTVARIGPARALWISVALAAVAFGALLWQSVAGVLPPWSAVGVVGLLPLLTAYRGAMTVPEMLDHQLTLLGASVGASVVVDGLLVIVLAVSR
jgi:1,4-dihydroxy-2-naphthoate octaprenyltransferase